MAIVAASIIAIKASTHVATFVIATVDFSGIPDPARIFIAITYFTFTRFFADQAE
ncbi:MAG: hypothetical protein Q3963_02445 [Coriobacteriaceae bacterium]|nr:hypothetical protein [Coriobacteriaceae bacterium]